MTLYLTHEPRLLDFLRLVFLVVRVFNSQAPNVKVVTYRGDDIVLSLSASVHDSRQYTYNKAAIDSHT